MFLCSERLDTERPTMTAAETVLLLNDTCLLYDRSWHC